MSDFIPSKTNWTGSPKEFFNVDPDYQRIKNNIELIYANAKKFYKKEFIIYDMPTLVVNTDHVYVEYLNNIVYNIDIIKNNTYQPINYTIVGVFQENGSIWNFKDLNAIERNIALLHIAILSKESMQAKVGFTRMGFNGGL